jgi:hydrogenase maturation factor HypE
VAEGLQAEAGLLTREALDEEIKVEQEHRDRLGMAAAFFGDASLAPDMEAQREVSRAKGSLTMLETARDWAAAVGVEDTRPVNERAVERGDALLARAGDSGLGVESRDSLYQAAESYFKFADNLERLRTAEVAREKIAPAVKAEVDKRNAKIARQGDELRKSAQQMKQSVDKTKAQKESFKKEADALEDELGF